MAIVQTTMGEMDDSLLWKHTAIFEDDNKYTTATEYWYPREGRVLSEKTLVHRSVNVGIKQGIETKLEQGEFA
jgi:hypothetical protein